MTATWKAGWPMPVATGSGSQSVAPSGPLADSEWQWPGLALPAGRPGLAGQPGPGQPFGRMVRMEERK